MHVRTAVCTSELIFTPQKMNTMHAHG